MRMLLSEIRPTRALATHAHAFALPGEQATRKGRRRVVSCVDRAVQEEPVGREHIEIEVLVVVLAAREVGQEAARVVVVARFDAELRVQGAVHEAGVPQVAVQEGEDGDALRVGELS